MSRLRRFFSKSFTERNPVVIGAIAVGVILVFVLSAVVLNKNVLSGGTGYSARFVNAAGLRSGDQVLVAGVPVGTVTGLDETGRYVYAHFRVSNTTLPSDTTAAITVETLLGAVGITLVPGQDWSHPMPAGSVITRTTVPTEFLQLQNETSNLLSQANGPAFNQMVESLAQITSGKQAQVQQIIDGLGKLTSTVDARQAQVGQLIDASQTVFGALNGRDAQLQSVVDNLGTVLSGLDAERTQVANLISGIEQVASQTAGLIGANRDKLNATIAAATQDLNVVANHQVDLAQGVAYLGAALKGFASIGYSGSTENPTWSNTFTNLLSNGDPVLGACGYLDDALDVSLGPDPYSCKQRVGPPINQPNTGTPSSSGSGSSSTTTSTTSPSGGGVTGGGSPLPGLLNQIGGAG
ncbi:MAG TPA: MCE family protein [Acidimicrobiales bacterium]|nr:MCE family protein [Acidimicrobiales bacterium]